MGVARDGAMLRNDKVLPRDAQRLRLLADGYVAPVAGRCVQCGICSYNCPLGIDVRAHSWRGLPIEERRCLSCGACVARCPRGALELVERRVAA